MDNKVDFSKGNQNPSLREQQRVGSIPPIIDVDGVLISSGCMQGYLLRGRGCRRSGDAR